MGQTIHPTIPHSAATNVLYKFNILKVEAAEWPPQTNTRPMPSALQRSIFEIDEYVKIFVLAECKHLAIDHPIPSALLFKKIKYDSEVRIYVLARGL